MNKNYENIISGFCNDVRSYYECETESGRKFWHKRIKDALRTTRPNADRFMITEAAAVLKAVISDDDMTCYGYKEAFECRPETEGMLIPSFKGTVKEFKSIYVWNIVTTYVNPSGKIKPRKYVFNDFFIGEHIIPLSDICEAMLQAYIKTDSPAAFRSAIENIYNKLCVVQMLKIEDRRICRASNRIAAIAGKDNIYEYIVNHTLEDIVDAIHRVFYTDLKYNRTIIESASYKNAVRIADTYDWAAAVDLTKPYTIKLSKHN